MANKINQRVDFVYLFDVKDGNPNGDPDAGNLPRIDPETANGLITDVCLKRKIRNYVEVAKDLQEGFKIFIRENAVLNDLLEEAHSSVSENESKDKDKKKDMKDAAKRYMCEIYYDVRTFGAVMSTGSYQAGQVKGPVQITFARSIDPIVISEHSITRMAVTTQAEANKQEGDNRTMGRKATVPYGLYVAYGFISPSLAQKSGFTKEDENLLFEALERMFDLDHSAARGLMSPRKLIVFRHSSELGDAPAHKLFDSVKITKICDDCPRDFTDYSITIDRDKLPSSITIEERL